MKKNQFPFQLAFGMALVALFFSSCTKTKYYQLTQDEEQAWMPYNKSNKIVFANILGDIDTFKVIGRTKGYRDGYNEFIDAPIIKVADTIGGDNTTGGVYLYKSGSGLSVKVQLPHFHELREITNLPMNIANVNGKNYADVYIMAADPFFLDYENNVDTMYYSKTYGFIKYVDINGIEWYITN